MLSPKSTLEKAKEILACLSDLVVYTELLEKKIEICDRRLTECREALNEIYKLAKSNNIASLGRFLIEKLYDYSGIVVLDGFKTVSGHSGVLIVTELLGRRFGVVIEHSCNMPIHVVTSIEDVKRIVSLEDQEKVINKLRESKCVGFES